MTRKEFLLMSAVFCAGCQSAPRMGGGGSGGGAGRVVDAGPASGYAGDGVHDQYAEQGVFLVRHEGKLVAISSYCTHRHCMLDAEKDQSFYCPCHGSTFDPGGKVTHGPAGRDLAVLPLVVNAAGHVLVTVAG